MACKALSNDSSPGLGCAGCLAQQPPNEKSSLHRDTGVPYRGLYSKVYTAVYISLLTVVVSRTNTNAVVLFPVDPPVFMRNAADGKTEVNLN